jgi:hypothetical protein
MGLLTIYWSVTISLLVGVLGLHLIPYFEGSSKSSSESSSESSLESSEPSTEERLSDRLCQAPAIDYIAAFFTLIPNVLGFLLAGGLGFATAALGQLTALLCWMVAHELLHYRLRKGPKISRTLSRLVGNWQNHLALWITLPAVFIFWMVRLYQIVFYPVLVWTVRFPRYEAKDWITISRHKFEGLVGYDLLWCLYCDWMTGVWSLGTEMLRNVESFWCPIRFYPEKKCENCKLDFPDIDQGWVSEHSGLKAVTEQLQEQYSGAGDNAWYGHSSRQKEGLRQKEGAEQDSNAQP